MEAGQIIEGVFDYSLITVTQSLFIESQNVFFVFYVQIKVGQFVRNATNLLAHSFNYF